MLSALKAAEEYLTAVSLDHSYYGSVCKMSMEALMEEYSISNEFQPPSLGDLSRPICPGKTPL